MEFLLEAQLDSMVGLHADSYLSSDKIPAALTAWQRDACHKWKNTFKNNVKHYATQKALKQKYEFEIEQGRMHKHLSAEAQFKWQWPKAFLTDQGQLGMQDHESEWQALRKRHAQECWEYICQTQDKCLDFFTRLISVENQLKELWALIEEKKAETGNFVPRMLPSEKEKILLTRFVHLTLQEELPKAATRWEKEKDEEQKRKKALREAHEAFQAYSTKSLLALAAAEMAQLKDKKDKKVGAVDVVSQLVKDDVNAREMISSTMGLKFSDEMRQPILRAKKDSNIDKYFKSRRSKTPRKPTPSAARTRSKSPTSASKGILKTPSRSPSTKRVTFSPNSKNGGKGKGKDHNRKGKGASSHSPKGNGKGHRSKSPKGNTKGNGKNSGKGGASKGKGKGKRGK